MSTVWQQKGSTVYSIKGDESFNEINVTIANGLRSSPENDALAGYILACLARKDSAKELTDMVSELVRCALCDGLNGHVKPTEDTLRQQKAVIDTYCANGKEVVAWWNEDSKSAGSSFAAETWAKCKANIRPLTFADHAGDK